MQPYHLEHLYHDIRMEYCESGPHYAKLVCADCNKFIEWVSRKNAPLIAREALKKPYAK